MDKLMKLREFLYLAEAADYLSAALGRPLKEHVLLDLAIRRKLALSINFLRPAFARRLAERKEDMAVALLADDGNAEPDAVCRGVWDIYTNKSGGDVIVSVLAKHVPSVRTCQRRGGERLSLYVRNGNQLCRVVEKDGSAAGQNEWDVPEGAAIVVRLAELEMLAAELKPSEAELTEEEKDTHQIIQPGSKVDSSVAADPPRSYLSTRQLAKCFGSFTGLKDTHDRLSNYPAWATKNGALVVRGKRGDKHGGRWDPVKFALNLLERKPMIGDPWDPPQKLRLKHLDSVFSFSELLPWKGEWNRRKRST